MKSIRNSLWILSIFTFLFVSVIDTNAKPPVWAPAHGYRAKTKQIFFPLQNIYYDLDRKAYMYEDYDRKWKESNEIPRPFTKSDLKRSPQVMMTYEKDKPWKFNKQHREGYEWFANEKQKEANKLEKDSKKENKVKLKEKDEKTLEKVKEFKKEQKMKKK